jgi:L-fuconolactonase
VAHKAWTVVDSHVHLWDRGRFDYAWLDGQEGALGRDYGPGDFAAAAGDASEIAVPVEFVFVQADCRADQSLSEAQWVQSLADSGAPIVGIVAAAPLERGAQVADDLAALARLPLVSGVRRLLQDEPAGFAVSAAFVEGTRLLAHYGFTMDLCVRDWQMPEIADLVARCPEVVFVLDHLGKPTVSRDAFGAWASDLARLAALPNVRCKISGIASEAPPSQRHAEALLPWVRHALDTFGPGRCMFGSDWPVLAGVMAYDDWFALVVHATESLSAQEQSQVFAGSARNTYVTPGRAAVTAEGASWH